MSGSVTLYEDKSRGAGCDALSHINVVVDADSADHCCQGEAYCCDYGSCSSDSDYCGHRFRCGGSPEPGDGACDSIHVHYGEACSSAHGDAHGCPIVNVPRETWYYDLWSCDDMCGRVGGWCERAAYMSNNHCGSDVHEEYELSCDQGIRDSGLTYPSHTLCWCRVEEDTPDEDEDEGTCTTTALYYDGSQDLSSHDASKCREYDCTSHDGDCCGYDYETWCADGYTLVRGSEGEHDCWPGKKGYRCLPSEYFVGDYSTSYDDAKTYCAERDASLVTIHSQAENEAAYSACIAGGMRNCWLGLEAYGSEWYWHTGEALSWTNWDGSEGTCFCGEDRAFFKTAWHGDKWHDVSGCDCEDTYPLCERSGGATSGSQASRGGKEDGPDAASTSTPSRPTPNCRTSRNRPEAPRESASPSSVVMSGTATSASRISSSTHSRGHRTTSTSSPRSSTKDFV